MTAEWVRLDPPRSRTPGRPPSPPDGGRHLSTVLCGADSSATPKRSLSPVMVRTRRKAGLGAETVGNCTLGAAPPGPRASPRPPALLGDLAPARTRRQRSKIQTDDVMLENELRRVEEGTVIPQTEVKTQENLMHDALAFRLADTKFHETIAGATRNPFLVRLFFADVDA